MSKLPYMQFYPGDWLSDPALRACSMAAKGLWIDLLCLMWESPERGVLRTKSGSKTVPNRVAKMLGLKPFSCQKLIQELEENGVLSRDENGEIFSRRMVREEELRKVRQEAGRKGGNPNLVNQNANQNPTKTLKYSRSHIPYTRSHIKDPLNPPTDEQTLSGEATPVQNEPASDAQQDQLFQIDQKVVAWWNELPGVKRTSRRALTPAQRRKVESWVTDGFDWKSVATHFPLKVTAGRDGKDGAWIPNLTWFLEEGHAEAILDGKYDFTIGANSKRPAREPERGQVYKPGEAQEVGIVSW